MAHALTAARLLLALPFALLMARPEAGPAALAALVLLAGIATDLLDGATARRRGTAGPAGAAFDHAADCCFVTAGLLGAASRGALPWLLPGLVVAAFAQYAADSYWIHRAGALRASRLGRVNGILYFVPLAGDVLVRLGATALAPLLTALAWGLVASTLVSMADRLRAVTAARRGARGSPAGGRGGRWRR